MEGFLHASKYQLNPSELSMGFRGEEMASWIGHWAYFRPSWFNTQ